MGRLPCFPYGGTNRIRFKGYNLSRMAPPSKMLIKLSGLFPTNFCITLQKLVQIYNNSANLQPFKLKSAHYDVVTMGKKLQGNILAAGLIKTLSLFLH